MISIKSPREIELMREAGNIVAGCLKYIEPFIREGVSTYELDLLCEKFIRDAGATPSFKGYQGFSGSICSSINEVLVHGIPSKKDVLKNGDIISIDVGCIYKGYHGDGAWTFAVGEISDAAKQLLDVTEKALYEGLKMCKPGAHISDVSHAVGAAIKPYGYGIPMDYSGHGIGRNLHEDPAVFNDGIAGKGVVLKEGMTFCVEPMVQIGTSKTKVLSDGWSVVSADHSLCAHFEHTIVITKDGHEILTAIKEEHHG